MELGMELGDLIFRKCGMMTGNLIESSQYGVRKGFSC